MELAKTIEIVKSLADGLDPKSREPLVSESVYQNPDTARGLYTALDILQETRQRERTKGVASSQCRQALGRRGRPKIV